MPTFEAMTRLQGLGTPDKPGLLVSVAEMDVPYLTHEEAQERIEAATEIGANAVYGGEVVSAPLVTPTTSTRSILVLTNENDVFQDVRKAIGQEIEAVGTPWDADINSYSQGSRLRTVRSVVDRQNGVLPVFASIYSYTPQIERSPLVGAIETVRRYGADAIILPWTRNSAEVISSQDPLQPVPAFLRVVDIGMDASSLNTLRSVARAKDSGASGVVIGSLGYTKVSGLPSFRETLGGVRDVLSGMTPEAANKKLNTTRRQF